MMALTFALHTFDQVRRTAAYVDEIDLHLAELTVRETFDFSARCFGAGDAPGEAHITEVSYSSGATPCCSS